ncbi:MAG: hypothetical protein OEX12_00160 [Gammaproteobacteria bacterium]|nr:hypothetical protein [Gammaproteobacteria bacterium]
MKTISDAMRDLLQREATESFLLVEIGPNLASQYFRYVTLPYDFTHETNVYSANHNIVSMDAPRLSNSVDKSTFKITLSDSNFAMRPYFDAGAQGQLSGIPITVKGGFVNNTGQIEYGTPPGFPYDEFFIIYSGDLNGANYAITLEEEVMLVIEGASPMAALDMSRSMMISKSYMSKKFNGDTSYDEIYEGSDSISLAWGMTPNNSVKKARQASMNGGTLKKLVKVRDGRDGRGDGRSSYYSPNTGGHSSGSPGHGSGGGGSDRGGSTAGGGGGETGDMGSSF